MSMIAVDERTWNLVLKMLKTVGNQVAEVRRNQVVAWNILDHGVKAGNLITDDQSAALAALAAQAAASTFGGRLFAPASSGPVRVNEGFPMPINRALLLEGEGSGWRSNGGHGTIFQRRANPSADALTDLSGAMVACLGTDSGDNQRAIAGIAKMMLDGGADSGVTEGVGLAIGRGQGTPLNDVYLRNFPGTAFLANQIFNADWRDLKITESGDGMDNPAMQIGAAGAPGNTDGTITLNIHGLRLESNLGTDLKVTGNPVGVGHPSTEINILGGKCEGVSGAGTEAPYHHWEFAELVNVVAHTIFAHRTFPAILSEHLVTGPGEDRGVSYSGGKLEYGAAVTPPDYCIEILGGALSFSNYTIKATPNIAYVHIGPAARDGAFTWGGGNRLLALGGGKPTVPLLHDER